MTGNPAPLGAAQDAARTIAGHLTLLAEAQPAGLDYVGLGNGWQGGFARGFATADGERVIVAALTRQQFADLAKTTRLARTFAFLESVLSADFSACCDLYTTGPPSPCCWRRGFPGAPWPIWPWRSREPRCHGRTAQPHRPTTVPMLRWQETGCLPIAGCASDQDRHRPAELLSEAHAVGRAEPRGARRACRRGILSHDMGSAARRNRRPFPSRGENRSTLSISSLRRVRRKAPTGA